MEERQIYSKKKWLNIISAIVYIALFLGMIQFYFDENYMNDGMGTLLLLIFFMIRSTDLAIRDLWEEKQKSAFFNLLLGAVILIYLIFKGMDYLPAY